MANNTTISMPSSGSVISTNKVLRNTYMLLSMTLAFSALVAGVAVFFNLPHPGLMITLIGYFGLLFVVHKLKNSGGGILAVFALTGFLGYTIGPIVSFYLKLPNGGQLVMMALGGTAAIFMGLSAYVLTTKKDFSFMGGFLMAGIIVAFLASLALFFVDMPAMHIAFSAVVVLLMSGMILYETSSIIHGGETNYILATVTLYVSIYNLFLHLLSLLSAFDGD